MFGFEEQTRRPRTPSLLVVVVVRIIFSTSCLNEKELAVFFFLGLNRGESTRGKKDGIFFSFLGARSGRSSD